MYKYAYKMYRNNQQFAPSVSNKSTEKIMKNPSPSITQYKVCGKSIETVNNGDEMTLGKNIMEHVKH